MIQLRMVAANDAISVQPGHQPGVSATKKAPVGEPAGACGMGYSMASMALTALTRARPWLSTRSSNAWISMMSLIQALT